MPAFYDWHGRTIYISITTQRGFDPNMSRNPQVSLCVDDAGHPVRAVPARGVGDRE